MTTPAHKTLARASYDLARQFGVGGPQWSVTRPSGAGVTAAATTASAGNVTAYVRRMSLSRLAQVLAQTSVSASSWRVYAPLDQDIRVNDVLTSQADSALAFTVKDISADAGILVGIVEPKR